jgi:hypothetical protein
MAACWTFGVENERLTAMVDNDRVLVKRRQDDPELAGWCCEEPGIFKDDGELKFPSEGRWDMRESWGLRVEGWRWR